MSDTISLSATKREITGKQVRQLRSSGQTPAVVHDHGKDSMHITVDEAELKKVFSAAGKHHPVELEVDGKKHTTIIKEVTKRPATNKLYHSVFQAIKANETVKTEVPLKLVGEIPAERKNFLVLQTVEALEVEGLPKDLVDVIEVDASKLEEVGDRLHVSDINVPSGIEIKNDPETSIALVEMPKDQIAEADAAAADLAEDAAGATVPAEEVPAENAGEEAETGEPEAKETGASPDKS